MKNTKLTEVSNSTLEFLHKTLLETKGMLADNMPLLIEEILRHEFYLTIAWGAVALVVFLGFLTLAIKAGYIDEAALFCQIFAVVIPLLCFGFAVERLIKIEYAPRYFLIQEIGKIRR